MQKAIQHYEQAADYFKGEENNSSANKCMLKVAMFSAQMENYKKAIGIYEQVSENKIKICIIRKTFYKMIRVNLSNVTRAFFVVLIRKIELLN